MRHMFVVHSPITYMAAKQVILHECLDESSCVFVVCRGVGVRPTRGRCEQDAVGLFTTMPLRVRFWRTWRDVRRFDAWIDSLVGSERFLLYAPHLMSGWLRVASRHRSCVGFSFIEEGMASYHPHSFIMSNRFPLRVAVEGRLRRMQWYANFGFRREIDHSFLDERYQNVYAVTGHAFPGFERRVVVGWPRSGDLSKVDVQNILAIGNHVEVGAVDATAYLTVIAKVMLHLIDSGACSLHVKFHPGQAENGTFRVAVNRMLCLFQDKLEISVLKDDVSLEELASAKDVTFYEAASSVGLYAGLLGREVWSYLGWLSQFGLVIDRYPVVDKYYEVVRMLSTDHCGVDYVKYAAMAGALDGSQ